MSVNEIDVNAVNERTRKENRAPDERTFILTDLCMWEKNRKDKKGQSHCIIVIDADTGQSFHIDGGSKIRFIEGMIAGPATQEDYNNMEHETKV